MLDSATQNAKSAAETLLKNTQSQVGKIKSPVREYLRYLRLMVQTLVIPAISIKSTRGYFYSIFLKLG